MKRILLLIALLFAFAAFQLPKDSQKFLTENLKLDDENQELLSTLSKFDYAPLWTMKWNEQIIGFIGNNYQRLYMKYISIIKITDTTYSITGKSKVKSNVCPFRGEIRLLHIRIIEEKRRQSQYNAAREHDDDDAMERSSKKRYMLLAHYYFAEDSTSKGAGVFEGVLRTNFYIDKGTVHYNDFDLSYSDNFSNNQCVGTWTSYITGVSKKCNWGEFRIPYSGDLDIGAGEFSPNRKYWENGWDNYHEAVKQCVDVWW